jgi:hypothetical protein
VNYVIAALPDYFRSGKVPGLDQILDDALDSALALAALGGKRLHGRPAVALVIRTVSQGEKNDLLAVGEGYGPYRGHDADTHPIASSSALILFQQTLQK